MNYGYYKNRFCFGKFNRVQKAIFKLLEIWGIGLWNYLWHRHRWTPPPGFYDKAYQEKHKKGNYYFNQIQ